MGTRTKNNLLILGAALAVFAFASCSKTPTPLPQEGLWLPASMGKGERKPLAVFITQQQAEGKPADFSLSFFRGMTYTPVLLKEAQQGEWEIHGFRMFPMLDSITSLQFPKKLRFSENRDSFWFYYLPEGQFGADTLLYLPAEHQPLLRESPNEALPLAFGWQAIDKASQTEYDLSLLPKSDQHDVPNEQRGHLLLRNYADSSFLLLIKNIDIDWPVSDKPHYIRVYPFEASASFRKHFVHVGDYCWLVCSVDSTQMTGYFLSKDQLPRFLQFRRKPIPAYVSEVMPWDKYARLAWIFSGQRYEFMCGDSSFFWMGHSQTAEMPTLPEVDDLLPTICLSPTRDALLFVEGNEVRGHLRHYMPLKEIQLQLKK